MLLLKQFSSQARVMNLSPQRLLHFWPMFMCTCSNTQREERRKDREREQRCQKRRSFESRWMYSDCNVARWGDRFWATSCSGKRWQSIYLSSTSAPKISRWVWQNEGHLRIHHSTSAICFPFRTGFFGKFPIESQMAVAFVFNIYWEFRNDLEVFDCIARSESLFQSWISHQRV